MTPLQNEREDVCVDTPVTNIFSYLTSNYFCSVSFLDILESDLYGTLPAGISVEAGIT